MRKLILLTCFLVLVSCASEKPLFESPLSSSEIKKMQDAKKVEDIFDVESEIQLSTSVECALALITDMELDTKDNYIIADGWQAKAVYVFSSEGRFLKELGKQGQGPGEYQNPVSVDLSTKQEIWVADYMGNRINVYDENFNFIKAIICKPRIHHYIHLNSRDEIFMYSGSLNPFRRDIFDTIHKYNSQGEEVLSFAPLPEEILDIKFSSTQDGMTIDKDDFIYEMNPLYYDIRKFTSDGKLVKTFSRKTPLFKIITKKGEKPIIVYGPYYLEKGLILAHVSEHLEIYDTEGNFLVGELPFSPKIIATSGNCFYVEKWEERDVPEEQPNPKIVCYKLKI